MYVCQMVASDQLHVAGLQYIVETESAQGPIRGALYSAPQMVLNWLM